MVETQINTPRGGYDTESQLCLDLHEDVYSLKLILSSFGGVFGPQKVRNTKSVRLESARDRCSEVHMIEDSKALS